MKLKMMQKMAEMVALAGVLAGGSGCALMSGRGPAASDANAETVTRSNTGQIQSGGVNLQGIQEMDGPSRQLTYFYQHPSGETVYVTGVSPASASGEVSLQIDQPGSPDRSNPERRGGFFYRAGGTTISPELARAIAEGRAAVIDARSRSATGLAEIARLDRVAFYDRAGRVLEAVVEAVDPTKRLIELGTALAPLVVKDRDTGESWTVAGQATNLPQTGDTNTERNGAPTSATPTP